MNVPCLIRTERSWASGSWLAASVDDMRARSTQTGKTDGARHGGEGVAGRDDIARTDGGSGLLVGRIVIDLGCSTATACPVATTILGERFLEAVDRYVHHPDPGQLELRPEVTTALSAKYATDVVLHKADGPARQPVVMTVQRPVSSPDHIVCHVVDYSDNAVLLVDTPDRMAGRRAHGSAHMITAFAKRFGVDEITAYAILQYDASQPHPRDESQE